MPEPMPLPMTAKEAHAQAEVLSDRGDHLEAALRYMILAGTIGNCEMHKAGVDTGAQESFYAALALVAMEIRHAQGAIDLRTRAN